MSAGTELTGTPIPLKGIRRIAARRMVQAWAAPVFHLSVAVDMTEVLGTGHRIPGATVTDALIKACASALVAVPELNGHYADEIVTLFDTVNIGVAVATDAGLMVPVIHHVEKLELPDIADRRRDVVARGRIGKLGMADIDAATFTVSNLGMLGIDQFDAILNPPQVGILAVGSTAPTAVIRENSVQARPMATLTLTCDHRAVDGVTGARMLGALRDELETTARATP
ncbi:2-oxo acid dehydrogenase subunit E2 [Jatrophihabitans lederbergiae]|uniref:2-oxo acid dehydrogenase subunit E2 n=1 Tax=Jatrophihabitans lederbergiae TaxID=3075547 RepID=A0ABU2JER5_9ACTN|nr:2-oxo acid dehydrogenase subunit E2 [Jatrophihabitans sp. DSM 44399]MDT0263218.1 2-oxo acid dehydrogenase subunit E2 [Jatrophihabitans sp. DSM 44399]